MMVWMEWWFVFLAVPPPDAAFVMSAAVILPLGPVPTTAAMSTPISLAIFFASGDATTRSPEAACGATVLGAATFACGAATAAVEATETTPEPPPRVEAYALSFGISS
jgi:hypothetical protein